VTGSLAVKLGGLVGATAIRLWMRLLDYQVAYYDPAVDPALGPCPTQAIYVFWHENILFPIYLRGHNNLTMLLSRHRDADILARAAYHLGFDVVRGSTYRGSISAVRQLAREGRQRHLTITPDGPRGPRRIFAQGPVYLSSKLQLPLVLMGFGYDRPWRLRSWDRFAIPRPGSRARGVVSPYIQMPANLSRHGLEHYRLRMEQLLNRLTDEAEAWAESGTRKINQVACLRRPSPLGKRIDQGGTLAGPNFARTARRGGKRPEAAAES
jgi:lysophospholipid acyltransferase (LPLAT)-like uncharacterized protein